MQRISQVLQLPVIINRGRLPAPEFQRLQELDFLTGRVAAQGRVAQKSFEPWFDRGGWCGLLLGKLKSLQAARGALRVQHDSDAEGLQVDVPGFDYRVQERDAVFSRDVKHVGVQELEPGRPRWLIAAIARLRRP